ncbi:Splicing factor 45 45 kDa-splicing factor RNA-binding motif protein 17 [Takifugu flavidus]|uniref:Splicing factor 45 n=1 Tax=Takifugu flavidus TaxID=433684 RepID=A0A5C6NAE5_9TELE|nr:Splicing factor 45 45 kDa-splicing factor RNA-binding motif protein 17 [Takifugu flavidus]
MSLYDDLGVGASDTKTEGWSKNFKLLQSQLKVKKAALTQAKTQRVKQTTVLAPVIDLKRGGSSDDRQISEMPPHAAAGMKDTVPSGFSSSDVLIPLADEYDPMFPNDYEKVMKRHREERQRQREQERQKEIEEREKKRKDRHEGGAPSGFSRFPAAEGDSDEDEDYEKERRKRSMGGAAIAPPSSLVDREGPSSFSYEDEAPSTRGAKAAIPPPMFEDPDRPRSPPGPTSSFLANMGGTVAHKIMQKYGFKEGQGLGKHEQGLSTALSVEKTSKRGGKIIIGDAAEKRKSSSSAAFSSSGSTFTPASVGDMTRLVLGRLFYHDFWGQSSGRCRNFSWKLCRLANAHVGFVPLSQAAVSLLLSRWNTDGKKSEANPLTEILKNPTKVVLLRNMVGRGEVDEDLEEETKEECEKYGKVVKCVIFEIAEVPDDEAVRIFLEFERVESAIKGEERRPARPRGSTQRRRPSGGGGATCVSGQVDPSLPPLIHLNLIVPSNSRIV